MTKQEQERITNRILISMAMGFGFLIMMYYLYGALASAMLRPAPTFWTICGLFVVGIAIMLWKYMGEAKKQELSFAEGYKKDLKARMFANFAIFFAIGAILSVVTLYGGYRTMMKIIAWGIGGYIVLLIIGSYIYQAMVEKKAKKVKISAKAAAKAAKNAQRQK